MLRWTSPVSGRRRSRTAVVAVALIVTITAGCGDARDEQATDTAPISRELAHYLSDSAPIVAGLDTTNVDGLLSDVWYGRILPGGRGVVLADRTGPFLRVFDRTGRLITTALPLGHGPEEARRVSGLAVSDAGHVLVLTGLQRTRIVMYAFEGDSLRFLRAQPSPLDIPMFAVASRCGEGWAAYTTRHLRSPTRTPVLAVSDYDSSGDLVWRNAANWVTQTLDFGWGSPQDMTADERHVYVRHKYDVARPVLVIPCKEGSDTVVVLRYTERDPRDPSMQPIDDRGGAALAITYPDTSFTGFSVHKGILYESETVTEYQADGSRYDETTIFSITEGGSRASVRVPGEWEILHGRSGELLIFGEHGPTLNPIGLLVPTEAVKRAVSEEAGSSGG